MSEARTPSTRRNLARMAAFLLAVCAFAAGIWWLGFRAELDQLRKRGESDIALAASALTSQIQRFSEVAVLMADHPELGAALRRGTGGPRVEALLQDAADKTGSLGLLLADRTGAVVAGSGGAADVLADDGAFRRTLHGALGRAYRVTGARRLYTTGAPVFAADGTVEGAVLVRVDLDALEADWPARPEPVWFSTPEGLAFSANRVELILAGGSRAFPDVARFEISGHDLWRLDAGRYLPARSMHLALPLPVVGLTAHMLLDLTPAIAVANLQAAVAAALCLAFGAVIFLTASRWRAEAAANARLEARVAERTEQLQAANRGLRREIGERREAEARLKRAQADLVQAGKLSALGQMSAGISHELNQPLMAIQGFAENGALLIERGKTDEAATNLTRISELARRMGRIIRNLRAFARQETVEVTDVDLAAVVEAALEISGPKIARGGVVLNWTPPPAAVMVRGGDVRLQQVVMNLVSNAVDAMEGAEDRCLSLAIHPGDPVRLVVRDTGPGIAEPGRIFDPFYSTKEVGAAEGMGLGLSISYGLVQSFGGAIRGRNHDDGGAEFTVELAPARAEAAA